MRNESEPSVAQRRSLGITQGVAHVAGIHVYITVQAISRNDICSASRALHCCCYCSLTSVTAGQQSIRFLVGCFSIDARVRSAFEAAKVIHVHYAVQSSEASSMPCRTGQRWIVLPFQSKLITNSSLITLEAFSESPCHRCSWLIAFILPRKVEVGQNVFFTIIIVMHAFRRLDRGVDSSPHLTRR